MLCLAAVADAQRVLLVEPVAEVQGGRHAHIIPGGYGVECLVVVFHPLALGLDVHAQVHVDLGGHQSELHVDVVDVVRVVGVAAQVIVKVFVVVPGQVAGSGVADVGDQRVNATHVVGLAVAVVVLVVEAVGGLQEEFLGNQRLAVVETHVEVLRTVGCRAVAVGQGQGVVSLEVGDVAQVEALVLVLAE